jgi:hypothetical protein
MFHKYRQLIIFIALFVSGFLLFAYILSRSSVTPTNSYSEVELDDSVTRLGNPLREDGLEGRALNVWDLQVFNGKIYLAGGSTVANTGPINVWAYDPITQTFDREYTVDEEAIEHFKVFGDRLYIPAADPRQGDSNKFYRKSVDGLWQKYESDAIELAHVRDLIKTDEGKILVVGNNRNLNKIANPSIAITTDDGISFQEAGISKNQLSKTNLIDYNWFFSVFEYRDKIYAISSLLRDFGNYSGAISVYNSQTQRFEIDFDLRNDEFIPANNIGKSDVQQGIYIIYRIWKPLEFQNYLIYPVRSYSNNQQEYEQAYMNSLGIYYKEKIGVTPKKIELPHNALGEDILIINDELYVLANKKQQNNKFIIYVYKTETISDKIKWQKVLEFSGNNKARSFEYLNSTFYFGLGQDYGDPLGDSGDFISYEIKSL